MKTIIADRNEVLRRAAEHITRVLAEKPDAVLALSAGKTMAPLFQELTRLFESGELHLERARVFAVAEFDGGSEALSCRRAIEDGLISRTDLPGANCSFLSRENMEDYDSRIARAGGIDLAVLGIGHNAHIGFNEPATPFESRTHAQKLSPATRRQYAEAFGGEEQVPEYGLTMGIKTITEAREILLLALGGEKAEAVHRMVYGRTDSYVPAAFLQLPLNVTLYLDGEAANEL